MNRFGMIMELQRLEMRLVARKGLQNHCVVLCFNVMNRMFEAKQ